MDNNKRDNGEENVVNYDIRVLLRKSPLSCDQWEEIALMCKGVIDAWATKYNLSSLTGFIITDDLKADVTSFQEKIGSFIEMTEHPEFFCVAKTIHYEDPERGRSAKIFMQDNIILGLLDEESLLSNDRGRIRLNPLSLSMAILVHELGHIHNDFYIERQFGKWGGPPSLGEAADNIATKISRLIWAEYHAEHIASTINPQLLYESNLEALVTIHNKMVKSIRKAHDDYQARRDIINLWGKIVEMTSAFLTQIGRFAPYLTDCSCEEKNEINKHFGILGQVMLDLSEEAKRLLSDFAKWEFWTWDNLNDFVFMTWKVCGVIPEFAYAGGLYVRVVGLTPEFREVSPLSHKSSNYSPHSSEEL
jgi:hypothetical protein